VERTFTAVYEKIGDWYAAYIQELPGAHSQGRTLSETREHLREAIELLLQSNREIAERD
jgi:predicted RNase H-like HicB family nuclease